MDHFHGKILGLELSYCIELTLEVVDEDWINSY